MKPSLIRNIYIAGFLTTVLLMSVACSSTEKKIPGARKDETEFARGSRIAIQEYDSRTVEDLALLCKIWGFLKYYHPSIAAGDYNWDYELFRIMPSVLKSDSEKERNEILSSWIKMLGKTDKGEAQIVPDSTAIKLLPDIDWINDKTLLGEALSKQLNEIKNTKRTGKHYYVEFFPNTDNPNFINEKAYARMRYPDTGYRLLSLFRYWNIIQYFYPYKYLTDKNWNEVLVEFIPKFIYAKSNLGYTLTVQRLVAQINDSHAIIQGNESLDRYIGKNSVPAEVTFVENKAVITHICKGYEDKTPIKIGDVILSINNISVDSIIRKKRNFISASNHPTLLRDVAAELLRSSNAKLPVTYQRENKILKDTLKFYPRKSLPIRNLYQRYLPLVKTFDNDITYLYLGTMKKSSIPDSITSRGLIIDLRCYPSLDAVSGFEEFKQLYPTKTAYAKETKGSLEYPGMFTYKAVAETGSENPNHYKGKIIILINELSQSLAEVTAMKYRCAPNAVFIGSQTAGADGFISRIVLPGGIGTRITGTGIYYPDGRETQRIGIIPDIEVKPTIKGIREGRDEVLEKAIEIINQQ